MVIETCPPIAASGTSDEGTGGNGGRLLQQRGEYDDWYYYTDDDTPDLSWFDRDDWLIFEDDYYKFNLDDVPDTCYSDLWHASQLIGPPDHYPLTGASALTWSTWQNCCRSDPLFIFLVFALLPICLLRLFYNRAWVVVEFPVALYISDIEIFETVTHGSVTEVLLPPRLLYY